MFCTQCGTQIDQGTNFCKNCGARIGHSAAPASSQAVTSDPIEATAPAQSSETSSQQVVLPMPVSLPREGGGNSKLIIVAAGVAVIVLAAAGVYFGTDLLKPSSDPTTPRVAEPMTKAAEAPPLPSFEDTKDAGPAGDNSLASGNPPVRSEPAPPSPTEATKGQPEILPAPAPRTNVPPAPTQSQMQRAAQDTPVSGRATKSPPSLPASRGGAAAGIYETRRATTVYEEPSATAKTVASIPSGTQVNVVSSSGDWLEVHSKRGNPPGFIRRDDATFIEKSN